MEKSHSPARISPAYSAEDFIHPIANLRQAAKAGGYAGLAYFLDMCLTEATIQADAEARKASTRTAHRPT